MWCDRSHMSAAADVIGQPFHIFSCTGTEGVPSRVVQARVSNHFTPDSPRMWSTVGALRIMWRDRSHMSAAADVIGAAPVYFVVLLLPLIGIALQTAGVAVWLDNHMLDTDWCCTETDCNAFWFNANHSMTDWIEAWRVVARRSRQFRAVVAAALKNSWNEIRRVTTGKSWGSGPFCDAYVVLEENPDLLISLSGLDYSFDLREDKVVFEAHSYSWQHFAVVFDVLPGSILGRGIFSKMFDLKEEDMGPLPMISNGLLLVFLFALGSRPRGQCDDCEMRSGEGAGPRMIRRYDPGLADFAQRSEQWWGYLVKQGIAPVVVTEFGMSHDFRSSSLQSPDVAQWWEKLSGYLTKDGPLADDGGRQATA
ncbi:hypothetical protein AK812_SmicGene6958 [Symbiodinium microadriaticum]|uniref:Glycoside hydrolase family 5 domain-containing protein n=1 Tax=Symbiodinium microadriaticum TaxID=2951 RepID=A0A1Q9EPT9_SYMMI|nr:hypothetical protein AK812_SmicGene6958 [Symbiodinium microadriaticum]